LVGFESLNGTLTYKGDHATVERGHAFLTRAGFKPTIPVFECSETSTLDLTAPETDVLLSNSLN